MARGKHAARSIKRANDAAVAHIDRLTSELVEAKLRARQVQQAANSVPALRERVAELEREIAEDEHVARAYRETNDYWVGEMRRVLRSTFEMIDTLEREYEYQVAKTEGEMVTCSSFERALADLPVVNEIVGLAAPRHWRREMGERGTSNAMLHAFTADLVSNFALSKTQPWVMERLRLWKAKQSSPQTVADCYLEDLALKAPGGSDKFHD